MPEHYATALLKEGVDFIWVACRCGEILDWGDWDNHRTGAAKPVWDVAVSEAQKDEEIRRLRDGIEGMDDE
jgi:hypothetical protein